MLTPAPLSLFHTFFFYLFFSLTCIPHSFGSPGDDECRRHFRHAEKERQKEKFRWHRSSVQLEALPERDNFSGAFIFCRVFTASLVVIEQETDPRTMRHGTSRLFRSARFVTCCRFTRTGSGHPVMFVSSLRSSKQTRVVLREYEFYSLRQGMRPNG